MFSDERVRFLNELEGRTRFALEGGTHRMKLGQITGKSQPSIRAPPYFCLLLPTESFI